MSEELKPLTVEQIEALLYFVHPDDRKPTAREIHAAMPPDQSARIRELEQQRDALLTTLEQLIGWYQLHIKMANDTIESIKSGQKAEGEV